MENFGAPRDSMVGKYCVPAIGRRLSRHMTTYTVPTFCGMLLVECSGVTTEASLPKVFNRTSDYSVWIVAGSTPQPAIAFSGADAESQLLGVADHFDLPAC
jgi:hypothetical protein